MKCPRDASPLAQQEHHGVAVLVCPKCGGMFLDHGELNKVTEPTIGDLEYSTLRDDSRQHADAYGPTRCPRCDATMEKVEFNIETGIILDHCPGCHGYWLDGRELTRINDEIRQLNEASRRVPDPPLVRFSQFIWALPFPK